MYALVIGRSYPDAKTGMMGIFEYEQAVALNNSGYKTVYCFCDTRSIKRLQKYGHVKLRGNDLLTHGYHLPIGGLPQKLLAKIKASYYKKILKKIIKDAGVPDIIHVHFPLLTLNNDIWILLRSLKRPIVVTEHWTKVQTKELLPHYSNFLNRVVEETDTFICVGDQLKKSVLELTNTNNNIQIIPNMVKPLFYYEKQFKKNDCFEFVTVGRLVEVKRFSFVIDAFTRAFSKNNKVHLTIVGGGPLFDQLKRQINTLGMTERISLIGFQTREKTANIIRKSDAFVSGSILETFGVPFIEAMACGKPVIGIENGPIDKYINTSNGVLFQQDNLDDLVKAIKKVYIERESYDPELIAEAANKYFSEEAVVKQLKNTFEDCLERYC